MIIHHHSPRFPLCSNISFLSLPPPEPRSSLSIIYDAAHQFHSRTHAGDARAYLERPTYRRAREAMAAKEGELGFLKGFGKP